MSINVNATYGLEAAKKEGIGIIDSYILNASNSGFDPLYFANWNGNVIGFELNATGDLLDATAVYTGLPISRDPIKTNLQGEASGIAISIPNVDRGIEAYIQNRKNLRGCDVYALTAFIKHYPSGSSAAHIGTSPDRYAVVKEKLYVDAVSSDENAVSFTCKPKLIIRGKTIPGRTFSRECTWAKKDRYNGIECSPSGELNSTQLASYPTCDGSLEQCEERRNQSRYGGFPSVPDKGIAIV